MLSHKNFWHIIKSGLNKFLVYSSIPMNSFSINNYACFNMDLYEELRNEELNQHEKLKILDDFSQMKKIIFNL